MSNLAALHGSLGNESTPVSAFSECVLMHNKFMRTCCSDGAINKGVSSRRISQSNAQYLVDWCLTQQQFCNDGCGADKAVLEVESQGSPTAALATVSQTQAHVSCSGPAPTIIAVDVNAEQFSPDSPANDSN